MSDIMKISENETNYASIQTITKWLAQGIKQMSQIREKNEIRGKDE